jgi:hypothetical protein
MSYYYYRIYISQAPSLRFSHFWQSFDFSRVLNRLNADFLWIILLIGLVDIPQKRIRLKAGEVPAQNHFFRIRAFFASGF